MNLPILRTLAAVAAAALLASCPAPRRPREDTGTALVIMHAANPAMPGEDDLRGVFTGRVRHWPDGTPIEVLDRQGNPPSRTALLDGFLGLSADEYDRVVLAEEYRSGWEGPRRVTSDQEVLRAVAGQRGAIGVIAKPALTEAYAGKVKVVLGL